MSTTTRSGGFRARWVAVAVGVIVAGLIVLLATSPGGSDRTAPSPVVGKLAPPIEAQTTSGEQFSLDALRGQWTLVNFFATWCAPCRVEHPELVALADARGDSSIVSVSFNDQPAAVQRFFDDNGGGWPVIAEGNGRIALDYGVIKLPESYLIAPDGRVAAKFNGGVRAAQVQAVIDDFEQAAR